MRTEGGRYSRPPFDRIQDNTAALERHAVGGGKAPPGYDFFGTSATSRIDVVNVSSWKWGRR